MYAPNNSPLRRRGRAGVADRLRIKTRDKFTCKACGRVTTDLQVDHIIPLAVSQDDSDANKQSLCGPCHSAKSIAEASGRVSHVPEWLPKPLIPVIAVCGPPAAGKSTYVAEHAKPGELVLDTDEIARKLTGKPIYSHSREEINSAVRVRNSELAKLGRTPHHNRCWVIVTASTLRSRSFWQHYASELITIDPGADICIERIRADPQRCGDNHIRQLNAASDWQRGSIPDWNLRAQKGCDADGYPLSRSA